MSNLQPLSDKPAWRAPVLITVRAQKRGKNLFGVYTLATPRKGGAWRTKRGNIPLDDGSPQRAILEAIAEALRQPDRVCNVITISTDNPGIHRQWTGKAQKSSRCREQWEVLRVLLDRHNKVQIRLVGPDHVKKYAYLPPEREEKD